MSAKQPRKRRRLNEGESSGIESQECIPLAKPNQVRKSSKDRNRGMYPKLTRTALRDTFTKASDLINSSKSKENDIESKVIDLDSSDSETNQPILQIPKRSRKFDPSVRITTGSCSGVKASESLDIKMFTSSFSGSSSKIGNKISNYFKPLPCTKIKKETKNDSVSANNVPGTSYNSQPETDKKLSIDIKNELFFEKFRNCYGLLGEPISEELDDRPNYFEKLPPHIIENILCQIPIHNFLNCRRVCKLWNSVIISSRFMDWKVLYYRFKMDVPRTSNILQQLTLDLGLKSVEDAFIVLIEYMGKKFIRKPSADMYRLLVSNERAANAELVLAERFPDLCKKESKPWSIFAMAILLSETVWDIYSLYQSLFPPNSDCSIQDVTNALYCAATFLLYFRNTYNLNYGLHYRVYYVLYIIENTLPPKDFVGAQSLKVPKGLPGQQSIHSYCESSKSLLTYEQLRILNHCIQPKQIIKIVALAGTGKTTTLVHLAQLYPQVKFLVVMYNKAMCDEAKKRFPANVTCKTAHSLAYAVEGSRLRYKLTAKVKPHDIVTLLEHKGGTKLHIFSYAKHVLTTVDSYICSSDEEMALKHVPTKDTNEKTITQEDCNRILKDAKNIWAKMIDRNEKSVKITHDVYLKLYQLSKPKLSEYQCIMVDEAQDCNPAMLSVMLSQNVPVILVGDPNQQIYGFRGAKNALQNVNSTHTFNLTKSFRFGPEIAYIASSCLEHMKHVIQQTLVGNQKPSYINGKTVGQYAIIARSNVVLFNEAVRLCCQKRIRDHEPSSIQGAFVGGIDGYGFHQLLDIYRLTQGDTAYGIRDKFISKFKTFEELTSYAKNADDSDLLSKIELIRLHGAEIPNFINTIREKCSHPLQLANVVFSTAHKSKGLEFDTVCLTDDYPISNFSNMRRRGSIGSVSEEEEYNIIYVAITRAKTSLLIPEKLYRILLATNEKFEYPVLSKDISENGQEVKCVVCSEMFTPHTVLALYRREMILSNGRKIQGGALCMKCRTDPKVRTRVELEPVIMYLDPTDDFAHRSMAGLVGPLPNDPPIVHNSFPPFQDMDVVYIINIHV